MSIPHQIPTEYTSLSDISLHAIFGRLLVLNHFSQRVLLSWRLFNCSNHGDDMGVFYINPLLTSTTRMLISPTHVEELMSSLLSKTMNSNSHGPSVTIHRIEKE